MVAPTQWTSAGGAARDGGDVATTRWRPARVGRSDRTLRIYWPTRWRLLRAARVDRRAGLPIGLNADTTPLLRDLLARRDETCEHERTRYFTDVQPFDVRLAQIDTELTALRRLVDERTQEAVRLATAPTERQLSLRNAGEQDLPVELVRQRRTAEHRRTADAAVAAQGDAQRRLDETLRERAQVAASVRTVPISPVPACSVSSSTPTCSRPSTAVL